MIGELSALFGASSPRLRSTIRSRAATAARPDRLDTAASGIAASPLRRATPRTACTCPTREASAPAKRRPAPTPEVLPAPPVARSARMLTRSASHLGADAEPGWGPRRRQLEPAVRPADHAFDLSSVIGEELRIGARPLDALLAARIQVLQAELDRFAADF